MDDFYWIAVYRDGRIQERWEDEIEQKPGAGVAEFHLLPRPAKMGQGWRPYSLFLEEGEELVYFTRAHADAESMGGGPLIPIGQGLDRIFVLGVRTREDGPIVYTFVLPDGRVEVATNPGHVTRFERNCWEWPLRFYETWPRTEIPGHPGEPARLPGQYDQPLPAPPPPAPDPAKIDPVLPSGFARGARECEAGALVVDARDFTSRTVIRQDGDGDAEPLLSRG